MPHLRALTALILAAPIGAAAQEGPTKPVDASPPSAGALATASEDVLPPQPRDLLERALANRYQLDARASIEIRIVSRNGARDVKRAEVASKHVGGQLLSIGRFTYPEDMRNTALLRLGLADSADEYFMYLPEFRRVRRVPDPHKADMFFGSDANFEDVEKRTVEDYEVQLGRAEVGAEEPVWTVVARPTYASGYERVEYVIARTDLAILEQRFYKRDALEPYKVASAPREYTRQIGGHAIPMRVTLTDQEQGTYTELIVQAIDVDPPLSSRLFTTKALAQEVRLPAIRSDPVVPESGAQ